MSVINWFEIPATDLHRAKGFYESVLQAPLVDMPMEGMQLAAFPSSDDRPSGALAKSEHHSPSSEGCLVYLNGGDDLDGMLRRVERAGGTVVMPKTGIGDLGFIAQFIDSEGNRVALHGTG